MGRLAAARRERLILDKLWEAARQARQQSPAGPAVMVAALFEGRDPNVLLAEAITRFRYISWEVLSTRSEFITGGGPLDVVGRGSHDHGEQKWTALNSWVDDFQHAQHRSPRLWIDKFCINQKNIKAERVQ